MEFFKKNFQRRLIAFFVCIGTYIILQLLSSTLLNDIYIFEWMARNLYCYTWLPAIVLVVFNQTITAYFITAGNLTGTIIGELLGDYLREQRMSGITSDMDASEVALRSYHHGVLIWLIVLLIFTVLGVVLSVVLRVSKKRNRANSA